MSRKFLVIGLAIVCLAILYSAPIIANACSGMAGDVNDDYQVIGSDVTYLVNFLHRGGPEPPCYEQADANGDCFITDADVVYLVNSLNGGPAPVFCEF